MIATPKHRDPAAAQALGRRWRSVAAACGLSILVAHAAAAPAANPAASAAAPIAAAAATSAAPFATVGEVVITHADYDIAFAQAARSKFYHGKPPEGAVAALQREVGQSLVDEILLVKEAQRRQLQPDDAAIQQTLDGYEQRYRASAQWATSRERLLPALTAKLQRDSLIEQLNKLVKVAGEPTAAELQQYWERHQDKFTTPEQVRLAVILLKVDPSSPQATWDAAREEGAAIVKQLRAGADFAELAKAHSKEASAANGGDMGLVHVAMLPDAAQEALRKLRPGEISDATFLLEGVAVFRIEMRRESKLNPLETVRERARDLWARDKAQENWLALLNRLRLETPVQLDDSRYLPLTTAVSTGDATPR